MTGVYSIKNLITNDIYIGSTANSFKIRARMHVLDLNKCKHANQILQRAWNKYGGSAFEINFLMACEPKQCIEVEQLYLDWYNPEYNICKTAGNCLGRKRSDEFKANMSLKMKGNKNGLGQKMSDEAKAKISNANKGRIPASFGKAMSEDQKAKIRKSLLGRKPTEEQKSKMSASKKAANRTAWNKGLSKYNPK